MSIRCTRRQFGLFSLASCCIESGMTANFLFASWNQEEECLVEIKTFYKLLVLHLVLITYYTVVNFQVLYLSLSAVAFDVPVSDLIRDYAVKDMDHL